MKRGHGERAYRGGCRCDVCRAWRVRANAISRARRAAGKNRSTKNPNHGTERRYFAGCRCEDCTKASARRKARSQTYRTSQQATPAKRAAASAYARRWRQANRAKIRAYNAAWRKAHPRPTASPMATAWPFTRNAEHLDPLTAAINAAIPRSLPAHIREEVAQQLAVDLLTTGGTATPEAVAAAVREYWSAYPVMSGRQLSLDAPLWNSDGDSRERWSDQLTGTTSYEAQL